MIGMTNESAGVPRLQMSYDTARIFMNHKGRMPDDVFEMCEWLREYAAHEMAFADRAMNALQEHMQCCPGSGTILISKAAGIKP